VAQQSDGFRHGLDRVHGLVLVLDAQHAVVAGELERRIELAPELRVVAVAERDVVPGALGPVRVGHRLEPLYSATTGSMPVSLAWTW
jgi:hypothetical protein